MCRLRVVFDTPISVLLLLLPALARAASECNPTTATECYDLECVKEFDENGQKDMECPCTSPCNVSKASPIHALTLPLLALPPPPLQVSGESLAASARPAV